MASLAIAPRERQRDLRSARRSRASLLAIKTPDSVAYCRDLGLEVERWLAEGLADLYVPGGYFQLNQWSESVALARRHGVKIYACLPESRVREATAAKERASLESLRARALAAWAAGVDGIEMFNHSDPTSPLWRELGDPALLRTLPKTYFASVQGASNSRSYYPAGAHFKLPKLTPDAPDKLAAGETRTYDLHLGDDLRATSGLKAQLGLRYATASAGAVRVSWNAIELKPETADAQSLSAAVASGHVTPGLHRVTVAAREAVRLDDVFLRLVRE